MLRATALACLLWLGGSAEAAGDGRHRWPRWPTEVERIAAPLRDRGADHSGQDHERVDALLALDGFASGAIEPWVLRALGDPSTAVKREALRICYERELVACVPAALALWSTATEQTLRVSALRVIALESSSAGLETLLGALRDDNDIMRAQAAQVLGWASTDADGHARASAALSAKLGDLSAVVRQYAAESLGILASHDATLAVARLLDDAEPQVRLAAARSLGQIGDPRAVAALQRALRAANEPPVVRAIATALVGLHGDHDSEGLMEIFDDPPAGLSTGEFAELLGVRPDPEPELLDALTARLRDPGAARHALRTLALLGPVAAPSLRATIGRGPAADIQLELERTLAAWEVAVKPGGGPHTRVPEQPPAIDELAQADDATIAEALAAVPRLARARDWGRELDARIAADGPVTTRRTELALAAVAGARARLGRDERRSIARLIGWAREPDNASSDRCLATLALGAVDRGVPALREARRAATALLEDRDPWVRACAAGVWRALARRPDDRVLVDPDARVRVIAVLSARARGMTRDERRRIAALALDDPSLAVRRAARFAATGARARAGLGWVDAPIRTPGWSDEHSGWLEVELAGVRLSVPALAIGGRRFAWIPGGDLATVASDD
jgi:HEAT repeat protein